MSLHPRTPSHGAAAMTTTTTFDVDAAKAVVTTGHPVCSRVSLVTRARQGTGSAPNRVTDGGTSRWHPTVDAGTFNVRHRQDLMASRAKGASTHPCHHDVRAPTRARGARSPLRRTRLIPTIQPAWTRGSPCPWGRRGGQRRPPGPGACFRERADRPNPGSGDPSRGTSGFIERSSRAHPGTSERATRQRERQR